MQTKDNPSLSSYYVGDAFYDALIEDFTGWRDEERLCTDLALRDSCRMLLDREARLLDEGRNDEWLGMYAPECLYWVPATIGGGDPRREVAVAFDDRRRLEDRVYRLGTGHAWSQMPASRTVRLISNVEVFTTADSSGVASGDGAGVASGDAEIVMVRSTFLISELLAGRNRIFSGWYGHRLRRAGVGGGEGWEILVKQVNLIDCDRNLWNPSITL